MNTNQLIENWTGLSDEVKAQLQRAVSTRGKFKGYIKSSAPSPTKDPVGWSAWQALIGEVAPVRSNIWSQMFASGEQEASLKSLRAAVEKQGGGFSFCLRAVEPPFRWSLFHNRYDLEKLMEAVESHVANMNQQLESGL